MDLRGDPIDRRLIAATVRIAAAGVTAAAIVWIGREHLDPIGGWAVPAVAATCLALAWAVPVLRACAPSGGVPALALAAGISSYGCVPETDPLVALAVVPMVAGVVEIARRRPVPTAIGWSVVALVLWAGVHGAVGRGSALVGALFAWWPMLVAAAVGRSSMRPHGVWRWAAVVAPAWGATLVVSRTGALESTLAPAAVQAALAAPVSLAASWALAYGVRAGTAQRTG